MNIRFIVYVYAAPPGKCSNTYEVKATSPFDFLDKCLQLTNDHWRVEGINLEHHDGLFSVLLAPPHGSSSSELWFDRARRDDFEYLDDLLSEVWRLALEKIEAYQRQRITSDA